MSVRSERPSRIGRAVHWNWEEISWFLGVHLFAVVALQYSVAARPYTIFGSMISTFDYKTLVLAVVHFFLVQLSISIIAHRNNSHRSFVAGSGMHYFWLPFFASAAQGPVMWWSPNHSPHHAHTDRSAADRHSPYFGFGTSWLERLKGFLWAHMGWLCTDEGIAAPPVRYVAQMLKHPGVRGPAEWERRHHGKLAFGVGFLAPALISALWGDIVGGILLSFLRVSLNYHFTWIVNSVAHTIGTSIEGGGTARNAPWVLAVPFAILSVGETNNHANHHKWPHRWQFGWLDPAAWVIWLSLKAGWAHEMKSV